MATSIPSPNCPRCGALVDPAVASGSCPACLLRAVALGTAADSLPAVPWVPPAVSELAAAFPQLEIVELIGHGGMGAVYKARQKSLGRWVALKILAPQHASKADFAERFSREAKVLAEVNHPHIVTVHDFGQAGEFYFLLMEFVDGVSLRQAMRAGRFTPEQALSIVPPICEALQFAHEHGIVHRDIKPENLLLDKEGRVKIADFGIARMMRASVPEESVGGEASALRSALTPNPSPGGRGEPESEIDLTRESILGTPRYMAPEQRDRPASVDHRADIYSLGVVLYEMLTGELPGPSWRPPSRHSAADVRLDQIVQRALEQNPDLRYQSATELRTQIETSITQLPPDVASQLLDEADDEAALKEVNALMGDMNVAFAWWDKLYVIVYFMLAVVISNWVFGFPHFSPTSSELNALLYGSALAIVGGVGWIVVRFFLRRRGAKPEPDNGVVTATSAAHRDSTPNKTSGNFLAESKGVVRDVFGEALDEMFQTSLGLRVFLFGCFFILIGLWPKPNVQVLYRLLGFVGLAVLLKVVHRNLKTPLTPQPVQARPAVPQRTQLDILAELFGFITVWGKRCLMISWLGGFGFLGFVKGLERLQGMFGFFGFLGVAALIEGWGIPLEKSPLKQVLRKHWKLITGVAGAIAVLTGGLIFCLSRTWIHADVKIHDPKVQGTNFTFRHEVDCPPGWNVWLVLENDQGVKIENPPVGTPEPTPVNRFQIQLSPRGRVRLPLEYLPTTSEGKYNMEASIRTSALRLPNGKYVVQAMKLTTRGPHSLLFYRTEGFMWVRAELWLVPDGQSPNSMTRRYGGPPYVTIDPPAKPKLGPFEAAYYEGKIEIVRLTPHPDDGQTQWMPNGLPCTEQFLPDRGGRSSAGGKVIKEITVRVLSNTRDPSQPVLRFPEKSEFSGMGSSYHRATDKQPAALAIQTIACPPEAREMTVEIGVADGEWMTELSFEPASYPYQKHYHLSTTGSSGERWDGTVQITDAIGDKLPVSFSYSRRDNAETRLVYELADGTLTPMPYSSGNGDLFTGLITIPVKEFESIKHFHVQYRRYQWVEFRNVSLELGHKTQVEVQSAY